MADKKQTSYFTYSDIEKRVSKKLKSIHEDKTEEPNATFKMQLCAIASYYISIMDSLQLMKKKEATDKRKIKKLEKLEKDIKSMYYLFGITLDGVVKEHQSNINMIRNFGNKQE